MSALISNGWSTSAFPMVVVNFLKTCNKLLQIAYSMSLEFLYCHGFLPEYCWIFTNNTIATFTVTQLLQPIRTNCT